MFDIIFGTIGIVYSLLFIVLIAGGAICIVGHIAYYYYQGTGDTKRAMAIARFVDKVNSL